MRYVAPWEFLDWEEEERTGITAWALPQIVPGPGDPACPVCSASLKLNDAGLLRCRSIYCDWVESPRPVPKRPVMPPPDRKLDDKPAPKQVAVAGAQMLAKGAAMLKSSPDDWKSGLGPKVRETKQVKYKIGVGDAHNPVLEITATSDDDAVAKAKKEMKKKLNAGEVREPRFGWVFHILERS